MAVDSLASFGARTPTNTARDLLAISLYQLAFVSKKIRSQELQVKLCVNQLIYRKPEFACLWLGHRDICIGWDLKPNTCELQGGDN